LGIKQFVHPFESKRKQIKKNSIKAKKRKSWSNWTWLFKNETTGYESNDTVFWFHPPRVNQYKYCELSDMPHIRLDKLMLGGTWSSKLLIMMGWHEFKGELLSEYEVIDTINQKVNEKTVEKCWLINVTHTHSTLGQSSSILVYDLNYYGFTRMDFKYYDGNRIIFRLKDVIEM